MVALYKLGRGGGWSFELWVSQNFRRISWVSQFRFLTVMCVSQFPFFSRARKSRSTNLFIFYIYAKWVNILQPESLQFAFKTLWSLGLVTETVKMSRARKEKRLSRIYDSAPLMTVTDILPNGARDEKGCWWRQWLKNWPETYLRVSRTKINRSRQSLCYIEKNTSSLICFQLILLILGGVKRVRRYLIADEIW